MHNIFIWVKILWYRLLLWERGVQWDYWENYKIKQRRYEHEHENMQASKTAKQVKKNNPSSAIKLCKYDLEGDNELYSNPSKTNLCRVKSQNHKNRVMQLIFIYFIIYIQCNFQEY